MIVGRSLKRFFKVQVQRIRMSPINKKVNLEASTSTFLSLCGLHTDEMRHDSSRSITLLLAEIRTVFIIFISITWKAPLRHTSRDV